MMYAVNVLATQKGQGSVNQGIQYVQDQKISLTKRSVNVIKEYRNYMWQTDKEGTIINTPEDYFNHGMDAIRYGFESLKTTQETRPPSSQTLKVRSIRSIN
jgi:phage terminase large subunit